MKHQPQLSVLQQHYPRWITDREGVRRMVSDPVSHGGLLCCEFNDDATPKYPPPPTLRDLLEQGLDPDEALAAVKEEERKAAAHEPPYCVAVASDPQPDQPPGPPTTDPTAVAPNATTAAADQPPDIPPGPPTTGDEALLGMFQKAKKPKSRKE